MSGQTAAHSEVPGGGKVFGIGVGPGDPGLVTVKAAQVLERVDLVVAPSAKKGSRSLALEVARPYLRPSCRVVETELPMVEDSAALQQAWAEAAYLLVREATAGREVAFVTLGDCMFYSTWPYVACAVRCLAPSVSIESIPGVTAMSACAAYAGVPLAQGADALLVWVGELPKDMLEFTARIPNLVFMKPGRQLGHISLLAERSARKAVAVRRVGQGSCESTEDLASWGDRYDYFTTVLLRRAEPSPAVETGKERKES